MSEALSATTHVRPRGRARPREDVRSAMRRPRGQLFRKYVVILVLLVGGALLSNGLIELYFSYQENQLALVALQREKAATASVTIDQFVREVQHGIESTIPPVWAAEAMPPDQRRSEFRRLLRQVGAITEIAYLDATGHEEARVSRLATNVVAGQQDYSAEPRFRDARGGRSYFSDVYFRNESEPYMTVAVGELGPDGGVTVAEVNLRLMWDVVSAIKVGRAGYAYVVDQHGRLIAHPDISLVLQQTDLSGLSHVRAALAVPPPGEPAPQEATIARDLRNRQVLTAHQRIDPLGWAVFVEQPVEEAFQPLYASAARTAGLLLVGLAVAVVASLVLVRRMVLPIQALQESAARIGGGALDQRIEVRTGDELEALAEEFNRMTTRLHESYANLEQNVAERTRELHEAMAQLEKANQGKSDMLSTVSHELRTPLGAIKGYATALLRFGARIRPAERREFLESIDRAADRLSALIEDLLFVQRLDDPDKPPPLTLEPLNLRELAEEIVAELAPRAVDHEFVCALPPDLPPVRGDSLRVRQVFQNLLENAVKYSPDGGEIRLAGAVQRGEVVVSVRDHGLGIPADHLTRVFERFHRVETGVTRTTRGTGLGLTICQRLVQLHGGRIWVESAGPGQGSTFQFTLPRWEEA